MRTQTESTHQINKITELLLNFRQCGITGWCLEVMFTSMDSIIAGDWRLMERASLIVFPIYGIEALLFPISRLISSWLTRLPGSEDAGADRISRLARAVRHGLIYMVLIFIVEYIIGTWFMGLGVCPWDYSLWPNNVDRVIHLKFTPLRFGTGLLFEYLTCRKSGY